jgi:hypothetical protein
MYVCLQCMSRVQTTDQKLIGTAARTLAIGKITYSTTTSSIAKNISSTSEPEVLLYILSYVENQHFGATK